MIRDIAIVGAGAMGTCLAFHLARAGHRVGLVARGDRLRAIEQNGIVLARNGVEERAEVALSADAADFLPADTVFVCVKTTGLAGVLSALVERVTTGTKIVTVQNGVEAPHLLAGALPQAYVVAARVHGFFEMDGHAVRHVGVEPTFLVGGIDGCPDDAVRQVSAMLANAGLSAPVSDTIERDLWEKFLLAAAIGGVGTALGVPAGAILGHPEGRKRLSGAMREIVALAKARGIDLPETLIADTLDFIATFPLDATSSLQRDLEAMRPSEYDALPGAVLRLARESGTGVSVHEWIDRAIRARGLLREV